MTTVKLGSTQMIIEKLTQIRAEGCTCGSVLIDPQQHSPRCPYRLASEALEVIQAGPKWHSEDEIPAEPGWFTIKRHDGSLCIRAYGAGHWWIPLKDGWISGLPAGFEWLGPIAPMDWDTPQTALSPLRATATA